MSSKECAVLAEIHNALNPAGGVLPKWTTTVPPGGFVNGSCCNWQWTINSAFTYGVSCDPTRSTVTRLRLGGLPNGYGLRGTIPPDAIVHLTGLQGIEIQDNDLAGTIPPQLGALTSLTDIRMHRNILSGSLPSEIAALTNLRIFAIDNNRITGLPRNFGSLTALGNNCWLEDVQDTCRPNPYPSACLANSLNTPMNTLPPCPLYTETASTVTLTSSVLQTTTASKTLSSSESFTTRSITVGPTSLETNTATAHIPSQSQPSVITRQQRYIIFGFLLGVLVTLFLMLTILRRRLRVHAKSIRR
ncbi:hypothetical protein BKA69DRAFT_1177779 [Paraphysoderma sedebokerense]|nr:hypothetical protein BKA69DRAFT_1177779 [Paraphysoderma sedebokerense]